MNKIVHILTHMYVYLIGEKDHKYVDFYKIGVAKDIERRRKQLQTGNPRGLYIMAYKRFSNPYYIESRIHFCLSGSHVRGEWFRLSSLQLTWIKNRLSRKKTFSFMLLLDRYLTLW